MAEARTKNSARNAIVAIVSKVIYVIISFICRTVFMNKWFIYEYFNNIIICRIRYWTSNNI